MTRASPDTSKPVLRQEDDRLDPRWLVATLTGSAALLFLLSVAAVLLFSAFTRERPAAAPTVAARPHQATDVADLHTGLFAEPAAGELLKQRQRGELARYGWVDREHGVVRVPIDVAIDLIAAEAP